MFKIRYSCNRIPYYFGRNKMSRRIKIKGKQGILIAFFLLVVAVVGTEKDDFSKNELWKEKQSGQTKISFNLDEIPEFSNEPYVMIH